MRRGILYLAGASQHLLDQSARLVADRIARSVQEQLAAETVFSYRITVQTEAFRLGPDIPVDIASIEVKKETGWEQVLDLIELNYLPQFVRPFAERSHRSRSARALYLICSGFWQMAQQWFNRSTSPKGALDKWQAFYVSALLIISIVALLYWLVLAFTALSGVNWVIDPTSILGGKFPWLATVATAFTAIALLLKDQSGKLDKVGVDTYAIFEYLSEDHIFSSIPSAMMDALVHVKEQGYQSVDILTFSLGAIIAGDVIYPKRQPLRTRPIEINNWITIGYPYDLITSFNRDYFVSRRLPTLRFDRWINVVAADDFLGSNFRYDDLPEAPDPRLGIRSTDPSMPVRHPDQNVYFEPDRWVPKSPLDRICPFRRVLNHILYWDDKDARVPSCFAEVAMAAGWTTEVRSALQERQSRKPVSPP